MNFIDRQYVSTLGLFENLGEMIFALNGTLNDSLPLQLLLDTRHYAIHRMKIKDTAA